MKKKIVVSLGSVLLLLGATLFIVGYELIGDIDVNIASQNPNSFETQEANRKLKLLNDAQASKRQGFIRLSEAEINAFLQSRYSKPEKNRTNDLVRLVKSGVVLRQNDLTFITWHQVSVLGFELPVVWQRVVSPQHLTNGWRLALDQMKVGKLTVPGDYWSDVTQFLGSADKVFQERKLWLANLATVMISRNEITRAPELRLYNYVPVIKQEPDAVSPEGLSTSSATSTNTLAAAPAN